MKTKTRIRAGRITLSHNQADLRTMETRQGRIHDDFNSHSRLGRSVVLSTLASLFIFAGTVAAQNFTIFIEWPIPGTFPEPLEFASSGNNGAYFSEYLGNKIGFLDINKNVITEWTLPPGTYPLRMVSQGQKVAFAEAIQNGKIGLLDPNGSSLTEWAIPQISDRVPFPKTVGSQGKSIFFDDVSQGLVGMVNSSTNEMTLWLMPGAPTRLPSSIVVVGPSSALQVWVGGENGTISMLDPATNTFRDWAIPTAGGSSILNIAVASDGSVIFHDALNNTIGLLNPATNIIRQWRVPTTNSYPVEVAVLSPGVAAFTEQFGNRIGTLNLSATPNQETAVAPTIMTVTPAVQVVSPKITTLAKTITTVTPTVTGASRVVTGGFVEYIVPTQNSFPAGLATDSNRGILFAEAAGNKIGLLQ